MAKNLRISIPEPCHENWAMMTTREKGRHCSSCDKIVVDFSGMTDHQVVEYFKNYKEKTCGRFRGDQLNHEMPLLVGKRLFRPVKYIAASLMAIELFSQKANAHDCIDSTSQIIVQKDSTEALCTDSNGIIPVDSTTVAMKDSCTEGDNANEAKSGFLIGDTNTTFKYEIMFTGSTLPTVGFCTLEPSIGVIAVKPEGESGPYPRLFDPIARYIWPNLIRLREWNEAAPQQLSVNKKQKQEKDGKKKFWNFSFASIAKRIKLKKKNS